MSPDLKPYEQNIQHIIEAVNTIKDVCVTTPLEHNILLSEETGCNVFLKREDLQQIRSYKIRGAYNRISQLTPAQLEKGIVCASAGNHAQGFAFSCYQRQIKGYIFMPETSPQQKVKRVKFFGKNCIEVILQGDTFDDAFNIAKAFADEKGMEFIHPFNDIAIIEGQGTVAYEIFQQATCPIDYLIVPVGGGGLISGACLYTKYISPNTKIIAVEPAGAASFKAAMDAKKIVKLPHIDKFVDGAAVQKMGAKTYEISSQFVHEVVLVPEGLVCGTLLNLYNDMAIVVEPAGALTIAALQLLAPKLKGKNVVCVVSGSNHDITRTEEIRERAMLYEGLKHYFIINFAQKAGALKLFVNQVLTDTDNIVRFEYLQKNNRENGPALIGIEIQKKEDIHQLVDKLKTNKFTYEYLNENLNLLEIIL